MDIEKEVQELKEMQFLKFSEEITPKIWEMLKQVKKTNLQDPNIQQK